MARNPKKYLYLTIGIKRGSPTHLALLEDAEEHGTKQLPTLAGIRLGEYYEMKRHGTLVTMPSQEEKIPAHIADVVENIDAANEAWPE